MREHPLVSSSGPSGASDGVAGRGAAHGGDGVAPAGAAVYRRASKVNNLTQAKPANMEKLLRMQAEIARAERASSAQQRAESARRTTLGRGGGGNGGNGGGGLDGVERDASDTSLLTDSSGAWRGGGPEADGSDDLGAAGGGDVDDDDARSVTFDGAVSEQSGASDEHSNTTHSTFKPPPQMFSREIRDHKEWGAHLDRAVAKTLSIGKVNPERASDDAR